MKLTCSSIIVGVVFLFCALAALATEWGAGTCALSAPGGAKYKITSQGSNCGLGANSFVYMNTPKNACWLWNYPAQFGDDYADDGYTQVCTMKKASASNTWTICYALSGASCGLSATVG